MSYLLSDLVSVLEKSEVLLRPLGFYNPHESPVAVYPELPIGHCQSAPVFSNFEVQKCGLSERWHAHFALVGSPALNSVFGIYLRGGETLVGFLSFPGEGDFDQSVIQTINDFAKVPEYSPRELPGGESVVFRLGNSPSLDEVYVGATRFNSSSYVRVGCGGQQFEIFGLLAAIQEKTEKPALLAKPPTLHLGELASLWRDQPGVKDRYLAGFIFLNTQVSGLLGQVPEVDHESLKRRAESFRVTTEWLLPSYHCWRQNAVLAMANYIANQNQELAIEAAAWLKSAAELELSNFHFPELEAVEEKSFLKVDGQPRAMMEDTESCSNCGESFEFMSEKFCGSCGSARGVNR